MHILIVDDEPLARKRLRTLLADCQLPRLHISEAAHGAAALEQLQRPGAHAIDLLLLDIHMPGLDGMALAQLAQRLPHTPAIVFVTAHAQHAVSAFELDAIDYLTKPVRLERLQQALIKAQRSIGAPAGASTPAATSADDRPTLLVQERGRTERIPLAEVLYLRAELKYVTLRTLARSYIIDDSLADLEVRHGAQFLRIHRNTLVARHAMRALERQHDTQEGDAWAVRLHGLTELLPVSRRQLGAVRQCLERT